MTALAIEKLADDADVQALSRVVGWAFGFPPEDCPAWFEKTGRDNVRVARSARGIVGGLVHLPMGQFFGGRSVPMTGIAGVAVAPEERGRGVAIALMQSSLRELAESGVALSTLYPATQSLYRAVGYEQAGTRFELRLEPVKLTSLGREIDLVRLEDSDERIERAYRALAMRSDGWLDRKKYIWDRVRGSKESKAHCYAAVAGGAVEGYVYIAQKRTRGARYDLQLTDAVALTPRAGRRLLTFIADHGTLADSAVWYGGPADALVAQLAEQRYEVTLKDQWMLRITDVASALEARGYPEGVGAKLELEIDDPLLPQNAGRFVLEVDAGRGRVQRGGAGRIRVDIRGLAALYAGYLDPYGLARAGLLAGEEADLARARAPFAGFSPCMPDSF